MVSELKIDLSIVTLRTAALRVVMFLENQIFDIRYYHWQIAEWEREIQNGYPLLRLVKEDLMIEIMNGLDDNKKIIMARALVKRNINHEYLEKIGEIYTEEEKEYTLYTWDCPVKRRR